MRMALDLAGQYFLMSVEQMKDRDVRLVSLTAFALSALSAALFGALPYMKAMVK